MRSPIAAVVAAAVVLAVATPAATQTFTEPKSKVAFDVEKDDMVLLGTGLRVKKIIFTFKAYAVGFYVAKSAVDGPLASFKGQPPSDELFETLQGGDFEKELVLHFLRNLSEKKIQGAMREALEAGTDPKVLDQFISYFPEIKEGEECTLRWAPGGTVETVMKGEAKPAIADPAFARTLFGLYVGPKPLQDDFKKDMVARLGEVLGQ
jgi:hypothetical protein